jgi:hypothetical protein
MKYTVDDYNVTIKRGYMHNGLKLWGIRRYNGKKMLDWRDPETWEKDDETKIRGSRLRHEKTRSRVNEIKESRGCEICGLSKYHWAKMGQKFMDGFHCYLQFDHIDPTEKQHNVCDMIGRSWKSIQKEIDKCRVVCFKCHVKHSAHQRKEHNNA